MTVGKMGINWGRCITDGQVSCGWSFFFLDWLLWVGEWRIDDCHSLLLAAPPLFFFFFLGSQYYFGWLWEKPGIYDTASISGVYFIFFFVGLRFSVCLRGFIPRPHFLVFVFKFFLLVLFSHIASLAVQFTLFFLFAFLFGARASAVPWIGSNSRGQFNVTLCKYLFPFLCTAEFGSIYKLLYYTASR